MGQRLHFVIVVFASFLAASPVHADDVGIAEAIARTKTQLLPRPVTLKADKLPLSVILKQLQEQTGNVVVDRRQEKTDPALTLALRDASFWPALDAVARAAGCGISTYQPEAQVALVDAPPRKLDTLYQGIFRITAKRITVTRDDDAGTHVCTATLEIAWEPRFEPLFLEVGPVRAAFAADETGRELEAKLPGQGKESVAGRGSIEVDLRLPAPRRSSPRLKSLMGEFHLTGPGKMLTFTFPNLKVMKKTDPPVQQTQDEVRVSLCQFKAASNRWSAEVHIDNPPGNPNLESFQSWLSNNRVSLEKGAGSNRKAWWPRLGDESEENVTATHAEILYSFYIPAKQSPGPPSDWSLVYRTPGRIVTIEAPFTFKDLPLP